MLSASTLIITVFLLSVVVLVVYAYRKVYIGTRSEFDYQADKIIHTAYLKDRKLSDYSHIRNMINYNIHRMNNITFHHGNCATQTTIEEVSDNYICEELMGCLNTTPNIKAAFIEIVNLYDSMPNIDLSVEDLVETLEHAVNKHYLPTRPEL